MRRSRGLSTSELAEQAGIATATLIRLEQGSMRDPVLSIVARVAATLETTIDELVA